MVDSSIEHRIHEIIRLGRVQLVAFFVIVFPTSEKLFFNFALNAEMANT